jgi:hypothetical protein
MGGRECSTLDWSLLDNLPSLRFIYDLYRSSGLPWVYGGDYPAFQKIVTTVVNAWLSVGFTVYFVFDGLSHSRCEFSHLPDSL